MDIYLIRKKYSDSWDEKKLLYILNELGLTTFERKMRNVADYWFGNGVASAECLENEPFILESGTLIWAFRMVRALIFERKKNPKNKKLEH